jgi:GTP-sensing pleiotropic transcriptional regulator CodY
MESIKNAADATASYLSSDSTQNKGQQIPSSYTSTLLETTHTQKNKPTKSPAGQHPRTLQLAHPNQVLSLFQVNSVREKLASPTMLETRMVCA